MSADEIRETAREVQAALEALWAERAALRDCPACYGGLVHGEDDALDQCCPRCDGIGLIGPGE